MERVKPIVRLNQGGQYNFVVDDTDYSALVAGMGSGKSEALRHKIMRRIDQNRNVMTRRTPAIYLAPTYRQIENLVPAFEELLFRYQIPYKYLREANRMEIRYRGSWCHMLLVSGENYDRYMGLEVPWIAGDELDLCFNGNVDKTERMFDKLTTRTRVWGATNSFDVVCSPEGYGFMWQTWVDKPSKDPELQERYRLHRATTWSNYKNLPKNYIPKLLKDLPPQLVTAYIEGEFVPLWQGRAYSDFKRDLHMQADKILYYPTRPMAMCFDFNVSPMTCTVIQRHPEGKHFMCLYTHSLPDSTTAKMCQYLIEEWGHHQGPVVIYGDATSNQHRTSGAGKSDREIIDQILGGYFGRRGGFDKRWTTTNPLVRDRVNTVNAMLLNSKGETRLYLHPENCQVLAGDFLRQTWKPGSTELDTQNETLGHAASGVGYFLWRECPVKRVANVRTAA